MNQTYYENTVIQMCAGYAAIAHMGQFRKDSKTPFIVHPARVAGSIYYYLINAKYGYLYVAAGWLHDVMEDCSKIIDGEYSYRINNHVRKDSNLHKFLHHSKIITPEDGAKIFEIVEALTMSQNKSIPKKERKKAYYAEMKKKEVEITVIKYCDRIDNLTTVHRFSQSGFEWYLEETKDMINELKDLSSYTLFGPVYMMLINQLEGAKQQYKEMYGK